MRSLFPCVKMKNNQGFTLLEVLVALVLVSIIGIFSVDLVGQGQGQMAQTKWREDVLYKGRSLLVQIVSTSPKNPVKRGTLAPDYPHVEYSTRVETVFKMKKLVLTLTDKNNKQNKTVNLDYYL